MTNITNIDRTPYVPVMDDPCDDAEAGFWEDVPQTGPQPIKIRVQVKQPEPIQFGFWAVANLIIIPAVCAAAFVAVLMGG